MSAVVKNHLHCLPHSQSALRKYLETLLWETVFLIQNRGLAAALLLPPQLLENFLLNLLSLSRRAAQRL